MMNLARTDTYINVYLPREDGELPRRYTKPISPMFNGDNIYKFSEQIVKDRKLFIGRKQTSLYEIYYKNGADGRDSMDVADEHDTENQDINTVSPRENPEEANTKERLQRLSKVSISLRRSERYNPPRFNEPVHTMNKGQNKSVYDGNSNVDKQTFDIARNARRRRATTGNKNNPSSKNYNISKLFKKLQSAPPEVRSLGLPPISRSHTALTAMQPDFSHESQRTFISTRGQPVRPSSKPTKIWNRSNDAYIRGYTPHSLVGHSNNSSHVTLSGSKYSASCTGIGFV